MALTMRVIPQCLRNCRHFAAKSLTDQYTPIALKIAKDVGGGKSDKGDVVVLHGMLGSAANWGSLIARMSADSGRRVIAPDMRNHGGSPWNEKVGIIF